MSDSEFIEGPRWRSRTTTRRRRRAALLTFVPIALSGLILMVALIWSLDRLGAPTWLVAMPWWAPTAGALAWTLTRRSPATVTDDEDDGWVEFVLRFVLVGEDEPRRTTTRVVVAVVVGAPAVWAVVMFGLLAAAGLFDF